MALTRVQHRTRVLRLADAVSSSRWDTTAGGTGEVDQQIGSVHAKEWKRILNANPYYRVAKRTPVADASGRFAIADLSGGSAGTNTLETFYRILSVAIAEREYKFAQAARDYLLPFVTDSTHPRYEYWLDQTYLYALPAPASGETATGIWVNFIPQRFDTLTVDSAVVDFPEDYEDVLAFESASRLLMKGAAETQAAAEFKAQAEELRQEMLQDIARRTIDPWQIRHTDSAAEWGG